VAGTAAFDLGRLRMPHRGIAVASTRPTMRSAFILTSSLSVVIGCAAESADVRDSGTDDVEDLDAKQDGAVRPLGLYELDDPNSFEEGWPRMVYLDLRRDDTFYTYELGPVDNNGNFEEGYNSYFGTYALTRDRWDNKYVRVRVDGSTWRYKYKLDGNTLSFFYRTGEVGWTMTRQPDPTAEHLARIREVFEAGTNRRAINSRAYIHPDALWSRYYDLDDTGNYSLFTINVDGTVHYGITGEGMVEIYAVNNQLLAAALDGDTWEWTEDLF
jgi:hypothetical protein